MKLNELIQSKFYEMSKSQKKVATYVSDYPKDVAIFSAQEIGLKIGISETTVIRFCYSLALSGFRKYKKMYVNNYYFGKVVFQSISNQSLS